MSDTLEYNDIQIVQRDYFHFSMCCYDNGGYNVYKSK